MNARRLFIACLFLSGAAGLVYQVVWIRMFSLVFGNTVYAVSMVVAGFLSGLALGAHVWGKRADRAGDPLGAYIRLEVGIAVSALAVTGLIVLLDDAIVRMMTVESIAAGHWQAIRFVLLFVILLAPTALMGGTLPVMSRVYVRTFDAVGRCAVLFLVFLLGFHLQGFLFFQRLF